MYIKLNENTFMPSLADQDPVILERLTAGYYEAKTGMFQPVTFETKQLFFDRPVFPKSGIISNLIERINNRFNERNVSLAKILGTTVKFSAIFEGPRGTGKTMACKVLIDRLIKEKDAIAFEVEGIEETKSVLYAARKCEGYNRLIVFYFDECERSLRSDDVDWKRFLDGDTNLENCVFLFTTNFIEKVPVELLRPSRIGTVITVDKQEYEVLLQYAESKLIPAKHLIDDSFTPIRFAEIAHHARLSIDEYKSLIERSVFDGIEPEVCVEKIVEERMD